MSNEDELANAARHKDLMNRIESIGTDINWLTEAVERMLDLTEKIALSMGIEVKDDD